MLCSRHQRKLKAIVAGSTGESTSAVNVKMGFYHVMVKYDSFSLPPIGNQGLMDILDMPNTNKYSFEG